MSKKDLQIARMKSLMTYGMENTSPKTTVTESIEGPDGKIYAIIREGAKYYIKSAPKGSKLVTESFNYIGGIMNKKNNEFTSHNQASKNLELKIRSLNESYCINKPIELLNPEKKENLMIEMTESMKNHINRYRTIINNANNIINEGCCAISPNNTGVPEAPKTSTFSEKNGEPFVNTAKAELDKDFTKTSNDPTKEGTPFGEKEKTEQFTDAQYVPTGSVANQKPTGGKVVRVNENEEYEETIEEIENIDSDLDNDEDDIVGFADDEISVQEGEDDTDIDLDDIDTDLDDEEPVEDDTTDLDDIDDIDDIDDTDDTDDIDEIAELKSEIENLKAQIEKLVGENDDEESEFELEYDDYSDEDDFENDDESEIELEYDDYSDEDDFENETDDDYEDDTVNESVTKLNVFGKHPGYRKKPMTLPVTGEDKYGNYRDWNDDSVYSEEPFGSKIGDSTPYDTIISKTVDSLLESLKKKH